jgi:hypothetical protein
MAFEPQRGHFGTVMGAPAELLQGRGERLNRVRLEHRHPAQSQSQAQARV